MKFNGTAWDTVGAAGFSAGGVGYTSLAFAPDGTPYLAYQDYGNSGKATVKKFNGTAWDTVGTASFSAGEAAYTSLAFAPDGKPYVGYVDYGNSGKVTVMKFNGGAWVTVGIAGFSAGSAEMFFPAVQYTSLAFAPNGTPYLAYEDGGIGGNSNKATVMQFATSQTATTTALQSSLNPSRFGQSVTLTATVSPAAATGSVTFKEGGSDLGTSSLSGGSATYINSALSVGSHSITAVYAGDSAYSGSTSSVLTQTINKADTTTGVVSSLNPSNVGDNVTFTATVTPSATGTVQFFDSTTSLGSGTLNGSSKASVNTSALTVGNHSIIGVYSGNTAYNTSTSSALTQTVNKITPTVNPWPTASMITYNQTLADSNLNGGSASVGGGFAFTTPTTKPNAGTAAQSVTFTPTDTAHYNTVAGSVSITVNKATAAVDLGNLIQTYTGSALTPTATTTPTGLTTNWTGAPQTDVGSYPVTATVNDVNYQGSSDGTFEIQPQQRVSITVATSPTGRGITVDGTGYTAPQTFDWIPGSSHSLAVSSPQAGTSGTRYPFANWSDGGLQSHSITTPATPATYTASFGTEYQLTLNAGTGGSIIPASGNWYAAGSTPSLISTASNSGYVFDGWNLDSGSGPVLNVNSAATQVTMNGPNTVSAAFKAVTTTLSASIGSKSGTIGGVRSWNVSVSNTGGTTANAARIDGLTLSSSGACKPVATTSFPLGLGDISPNDALTGVVSINFTGCKSSIKFSVNIRYSADGGTSSGVTPLTGVAQ
jgi:hypothetical protein